MKTIYSTEDTKLLDDDWKRSLTPVSQGKLESDLSKISRLVPFSEAALDVFEMTRRTNYSAEQIAAAIQRAPWLSADILARSNSSFYNPSGEKISDLSLGVARIGQKRVGELALSSNSLLSSSKQSLEWMDPELAWRRSLAAGVATEYLVDQGGHYEISDGLTLAAVMHQSGRAILGSIYRTKYLQLIQHCSQKGIALEFAENSVFPQNHAQVIAKMLKGWRIPAEVYVPLGKSMDSSESIAQLPEPFRTRTEILKTAIAVGALTTGSWNFWDLVDFPPADILCRLGIHDLAHVVERTEHDANAIIAFNKLKPIEKTKQIGRFARNTSGQVLRYLNLSSYSLDVIRPLIESIPELRIEEIDEHSSHPEATVVNCLGANEKTLSRLNRSAAPTLHVLLCDASSTIQLADYGELIAMPCSFDKFRSACLSRAESSAKEPEETKQCSEREPQMISHDDSSPRSEKTLD